MKANTKTTLACLALAILIWIDVETGHYGAAAFIFSFTIFQFLARGLGLSWKGQSDDDEIA